MVTRVIRPAVLVRHLGDSFRRFARNDGGTMLIAFTIATLVLRLLSNMVLTRLLDPGAFGILGVITSVMIVLAMLSDFGFASFVIRHEKGDDPAFLDVIWTIRLVQAFAQSVIMFAGAVPIALLLGKPEMATPIMACAPLFVFNAVCPMSMLLAQRQGQIRKACTIDLAALAIQITVNVLLAFLIRDYRALLVGLYVSEVAKAGLTMLILRRPSHLRFDRAATVEFFGFSRIIMASSLVTLLFTQADKILFVRLFSFSDFGVYVLAANLALAVQPFGRNYVLRFFFPLISRLWRERPAELADAFYAARNRLYLALFAGFGLVIGAAPLLFAILFDHRYEYGWIYLSALLLRAALDLDSFASAQTLLAIGRTSPTLRGNILRLIVFGATVFPFFRLLGPIGMPIALVAAEAAATLYFTVLLHRIGLYQAGRHVHYYGALIAAVAIGAVISLVSVPGVALAGFMRIG
jgi:O-antigen/teichoic acid export membrane protein